MIYLVSHNLRWMETPERFCCSSAKGDSSCCWRDEVISVLFETFQNCELILKKRICSQKARGSKFFPLSVASSKKGDNHFHIRVTSLGGLFVHHNIFIKLTPLWQVDPYDMGPALGELILFTYAKRLTISPPSFWSGLSISESGQNHCS